MILASHLHMPSYFLKTFTEYPVVWVFVAGPESPFFKVSGLLASDFIWQLARDCEHIGQKHRTSCYR